MRSRNRARNGCGPGENWLPAAVSVPSRRVASARISAPRVVVEVGDAAEAETAQGTEAAIERSVREHPRERGLVEGAVDRLGGAPMCIVPLNGSRSSALTRPARSPPRSTSTRPSASPSAFSVASGRPPAVKRATPA